MAKDGYGTFSELKKLPASDILDILEVKAIIADLESLEYDK